ncbi:cytochrome c oxidase assembly protein COX16 homolog, mitochondrial-like [Hylobates moloch]|uniref:cytochrome c oxidase assembly protein COX16 homolog, mitochondrial-like n=1 Tax=Hylobates moloch TaxID=81572 RepID=UPI001362C4D7|nr:cytochrome c oxidase assembly protein COX16 homolog, mitochondrial-like [Hylobates moloch]
MFAPAVMCALCKHKTLRYEVPMLLLIIKIDHELEKNRKQIVSSESEYEKIKDSTFDDWKNIQRPKPWKDPDLLQERNPEILKTKIT